MFTFLAKGPASGTNLPRIRFMLLPVAGTIVRSAQLVRNAVYSVTRSG